MTTHDNDHRPYLNPETRRLIQMWIVQSALGMIVIGLLLFLGAGRADWVWGWLQVAVLAGFLAAHPLLLIPINPELLAERQRGALAAGTKPWDKVLSTIAGGMVFPMLALGALDERFGWSAPFPLSLHVLGTIGCVLGYSLFLWAMVSNAFFAEGVRIQRERGHTVATAGPYRWLRHPGYAGNVLNGLTTPLLLGSWWALVPGALVSLLFIVRAALEDATLQKELEGYAAYAQRVRYRLVPGLW